MQTQKNTLPTPQNRFSHCSIIFLSHTGGDFEGVFDSAGAPNGALWEAGHGVGKAEWPSGRKNGKGGRVSIPKRLQSESVTSDVYFREGRHRVNGKPRLFLKAGVTNRDTFQTICQKVTGDGKDLIAYAYGVLMEGEVVEIPTSTGTRKALMYRGLEITTKDRIWAVEFLANRGFGKAEQTINISATIENKSTDELKQEALKLLHKVTKVQDALERQNPPLNSLPGGELEKTVIDVPVTTQAETQHGERFGKC